MDKKLNVTIEINTKTGKLKALEGDLEIFERKIHKMSSSMGELEDISSGVFKGLSKFALIAGSFVGLTSAIEETTRAGIRYNATLESMQIGIASLIAAQKKASGENIHFYDAMKESEQIIQMLKKANLETAATLPQLTEAFQAALAPATKAGLSIKQTVEYTKMMAQAAGAMGVPMDQLTQELSSIVSGTIDLNSVIASNLGITNEQIKLHKKQGDLFEFLKEKLSAFAIAGSEVQNSFDGIVSNLEDSWSEFLGVLSKPAFEELKEGLKTLTNVVKEWTDAVKTAQIEESKWFETKTIEQVKIKANAIVDEINELKRQLKEDDGFLFFGLSDAEKTAIQARIKKLEQELYMLGKHTQDIIKDTEATNENTKGKKGNTQQTEEERKALAKLNEEFRKKFALLSDDPYEKLVHQYKEYIEKYKKISGSKAKIDEWYYKELEKLNENVVSKFESEQEQALKAQQEAYLTYLKDTGKEFEYWALKEGEKLQKLFEAGLSSEQLQEIYASDYKKFLERFKKDTKETADYIETEFDQATKGIYSSFESNFFDLITGKFHDFKDFVRALFSDILNSIINPFARQASAYLSSAFGGFVGFPQMNLSSVASSLGLSFKDGQYVGQVNGTEVVIDAAGNIIQGADALPQNALSAISTAKSAMSMGGSLLYAPSAYTAQLAGQLYGAGFTTTGQFVGGVSNWLGGGSIFSMGNAGFAAQSGALLGGAAIGGLGGYALGSFGDMLFGKSTKAGSYGAIGGAIGSIAGPIGAIVGAILGSLFGGMVGGKWEMADFGVGITSPVSAVDVSGLKDWEYWKKDKWFGGDKKDNQLKEANSYVKAQIQNLLQELEGFVDTINGSYAQIDIILHKGKFSSQKDKRYFDEYVAKVFLAKLAGIDDSVERVSKAYAESGYLYEDGWDAEGLMLIEKFYEYRLGKVDALIEQGFIDATDKAELERLDDIYDAWEAYAKSVDKEVLEVIQEAFASVEAEFDKFEAFNLSLKGLDGDAIVSARNSIEELKNSFTSIKPTLEEAGVDVESLGDITSENFEKIYRTVLENDPTPETIEALNRFGDALLSVEEKARSVADALDSYFGRWRMDGYGDEVSKLSETYLGVATQDPREILKLLDAIEPGKTYGEYSGSQILAQFGPYMDRLIQDAKILDDGITAYNAQLLQLKEKSAKTLEEMIAAGLIGVDIARQNKEQAEKELQKARELVGVADLSAENFGYYYQKALEANPSIEEIRKWEMAKTAILNAANANETYADSLRRVAAMAAQAKQSYWQSMDVASGSFEALLAKVEESQRSSAQNIVQAGESFASSVESAAKSYADALKSASSSLEGMIAKLQGDVGGASYSEAKFYSYLDLAKTALGRGDYANYSDYVQQLSSYIGFLDQKSYASAAEAKFEKAYVLNQLKELKSPTDLILEQLSVISQNTATTSSYSSQIAANTFGTQEQVYALVHESLGGRKFEEVVRDGVIEGLRGDGLTAVLGQSLQNIETQLANSNAYWQQVPLANGKIGVLVDFDQDGVNDLTLAFDSSGVLQAIDTNTAKNYETIQKVFGDQNIGEVIKDGVIQGVYGENFSVSLGDTLALVQSSLSAIEASYEQFGDTLKVDFDHDGTFDVVLQFDATGHLQAIKENTSEMATWLKLFDADKSDDGVVSNTTLAKIAKQMKEDEVLVAPGGVPLGKDDVQSIASSGASFDYNFPSIDGYVLDFDPLSQINIPWFATGGYTGDGHPLDPAGIVHRGEFVVNAPTTRVLGLNKDNGGVFVKMLDSMNQMANEIAQLNAKMERLERYTKETAENTQPIKEDGRWGV